jgi:NAD(P)-dependent dehydrogenase (short-subunit alcohol dehydrogenase family)
MMGKLTGKIAVITGGSGGIGLATAQRFVAEGAYVFITGRRQAALEAAVARVGRNVRGVPGDVAQLADLDRLYDTVRTEQGRLDIVFANAGGGAFAPLGSITEEHFEQTFNVTVKGTLFTVQKALPLLHDGGSIILTGSIAGVKGFPGFGVYSATKAALRALVRSWTSELQERHIRANVISPGTIDMPILAPLPQEAIGQILATVPLGRMGAPEEIAKAAVFLASDDSSYVTGIELFVDGGAAQI